MSRQRGVVAARLRVMGLLLLFAAGLFITLSLVQYQVSGRRFTAGSTGDFSHAGDLSFRLAAGLADLLGVFCLVIPFLLLIWGWAGARRWPYSSLSRWTLLVGGLGLAGTGMVHLLWAGAPRGARCFWGGILGEYLGIRLSDLFGLWGARLVLMTAALLLIVGTTGATGVILLEKGWPVLLRLGKLSGAALVAAAEALGAGLRSLGGKLAGTMRSRGRRNDRPSPRPAERAAAPGSWTEVEREEAAPAGETNPRMENHPVAETHPRIVSPALEHDRSPLKAPFPKGGEDSFERPGLELLEEGEAHRSVPKEELLGRSELLESRLDDFGAPARVVEVHPGPVITRFELEPTRGVKVSRIANLADDLALALRAQSIRILAPIPGKGTVGVEIPNERSSMVRLREVVGHESFSRSSSPLTLALGKDISGHPRVAALDRMPHLLIAGSTGSGKSVCINGLLLSLLFARTPREVNLILIDPKRLELSLYNGVPHLLSPVVTEPKAAVRVLRWAVSQMEWRYQLLARAGVRDISGYNQRGNRRGALDESEEAEEAPDKLPYIVVVVDELADLMLSMPGDIEDALAKLAQMARAVGIHLILATQRPSVDVITGVIKSNFPSRIAFKVPSKTDSRTILDANGAEGLLGRGDMLFLEGGRPEPERIHGCFVSIAEVERVTDFWRSQGEEEEPVPLSFRPEEVDENQNGDDELFREAARLVITHQQGSASLLQRRLKVGYSRASRLIDMLEAAGVVGPFEGSKAREVLVNAEYLERIS